MSVAARRAPPMRIAEFLQWAARTPDDERWELLDGEPVLMASPGERHQAIVSNLTRRLGDLADTKGCRALPGLGLVNEFVDDFAPIPDTVIRCGPLLPDGYARDPIMVAEVLSPSTMGIDRGRKTTFYKALQTLRVFLIVYQDEPRIEVWRRDGADWSYRALGLGDVIECPELDGTLPVDAVYANVPFGRS